MSATKWTGIVAILAITILSLTATVTALPVWMDRVEVNDNQIFVDDINRIALERDNAIDIEVRMMSFEDLEDVELEAFVSGYEYNSYDNSRMSDSTSLFDMEANVTYVKKLSITLQGDMDQDDYKLRLIATDRNGYETVENYNLKIEGSRHLIKIADVTLSEDIVKQGNALLTSVRIENVGQRTEDDVKVTVSVPEFGISATDYIDEIKVDKQKNSEELYLRIPKCAEPGRYVLEVEVAYNREHTKVTTAVPFDVFESGSCVIKTQETTEPVTVVVQPVQPANDTAQVDKSNGVKTALEIVLLVLIGILVIIGLVLAFSKLKGDDDEDIA